MYFLAEFDRRSNNRRRGRVNRMRNMEMNDLFDIVSLSTEDDNSSMEDNDEENEEGSDQENSSNDTSEDEEMAENNEASDNSWETTSED